MCGSGHFSQGIPFRLEGTQGEHVNRNNFVHGQLFLDRGEAMNKTSGVNTITLQILALVCISCITSDQVTYPCCACFPNSNNRIIFYLTAHSGYYMREFTGTENRALYALLFISKVQLGRLCGYGMRPPYSLHTLNMHCSVSTTLS